MLMLTLQCYLFVLPSNIVTITSYRGHISTITSYRGHISNIVTITLYRGRISALDQATVQRMSEMIDQQTEKRSR